MTALIVLAVFVATPVVAVAVAARRTKGTWPTEGGTW